MVTVAYESDPFVPAVVGPVTLRNRMIKATNPTLLQR